MNYTKFLDNVGEIAVKAGMKILEIYETDFSSSIKSKKDNSPVTIADKESNDLIVKSLLELNPEIPVIAEESESAPYEVRKNYNYFWLVDPLDGTKEFINKNGDFTVNIALINGTEPVLGVVYVPVEDKLYFGTKKNGAYLKNNGESRRIKARKRNLNEQNIAVF